MQARFLPLLLFCLLLGGRNAYGCSCATLGSKCGALKPRGTMLLGQVLREREVRVPMRFGGETDAYTSQFVYRIRALEVFAGEVRTGEEFDLRTGSGGGDCGYGFVVGKQYLVDAYTVKGAAETAELQGITLATSICSHTREEEAATIELRELRTARQQKRQPDLLGTVRYAATRNTYPGQAMDAINVSLTGKQDGAVYRAVTDAQGLYTFAVVPPGDYNVSYSLGSRQRLIDSKAGDASHVTLPANDGTGLACHLSARVGAAGGLHVRVVTATGKPLDGMVLIKPAGRVLSNQFEGDSAASIDGSYEISLLADGEYEVHFSNWKRHLAADSRAAVRNGAVTEVVLTANDAPDR